MPASKDERDRILSLVETGQITAIQAAELIDALDAEKTRMLERVRNRTLRIRATTMHPKIQVTATIPVSVIKTSLRLGASLAPQLNTSVVEDLLGAVERGDTGRVLDVQDLEQGEHLEIFIE